MEKICKFYAPEEYNFEALEKSYFWFSNPRNLNDPFDCNYDAFESSKALQLLSSEEKESLSSFNNSVGICSFTKSFENQHFWALYADTYKGFCLVFNADMVKRKFSSSGILIDNVEYISRDEFDFDKIFAAENRNVQINVALDRTLRKSVFLKNKEFWRHEEEIRGFLGEVPM